MGSRSEPVTPPTAADHVITMCNGGVKAICNGSATVVKDAAGESREPISVGFDITEPSTTVIPTVIPTANDDRPVCPRLIITDADGVVTDQWEELIDAASSNEGSDQSDFPVVVDVSTGMNIHLSLLLNCAVRRSLPAPVLQVSIVHRKATAETSIGGDAFSCHCIWAVLGSLVL